MTQNDLMSSFFRRALRSPRESNYLLFNIEQDNEIRYIVQRLLIDTNMTDEYSNIFAVSLINQLLISALRKCVEPGQLDLHGESENRQFDSALLLKHIQQNYQTVTLSSLALAFHYSEPYLCKLIQSQIGQSFSLILQDLKLRHSKEYLTNTNLKISDISEIVGYDSIEYFSRLFKKKFKMTPSEFRKFGGAEK